MMINEVIVITTAGLSCVAVNMFCKAELISSSPVDFVIICLVLFAHAA